MGFVFSPRGEFVCATSGSQDMSFLGVLPISFGEGELLTNKRAC